MDSKPLMRGWNPLRRDRTVWFHVRRPTGVDELPPAEGALSQAMMHFTGSCSGSLCLAAPVTLGPVLAANVLGMDADDPEAVERSDDAIKELLNVVRGHILSELEGDQAMFDLGAPNVTTLSKSDWQTLLQDPCAIGFVVEDLPLLLRFRREGARG